MNPGIGSRLGPDAADPRIERYRRDLFELAVMVIAGFAISAIFLWLGGSL